MRRIFEECKDIIFAQDDQEFEQSTENMIFMLLLGLATFIAFLCKQFFYPG